MTSLVIIKIQELCQLGFVDG